MRSKLTLLFLILFASLAHAQYYYDFDEGPMFGLGVGYNFVSMVGDDVRPVEVSFRYRINDDHLLQLVVPFLHQNDDFTSQEHPDMELIDTSIDSKKRVYGAGLDYDYALQRFSSLDFVIGMRVEYQLYQYRTNLVNRYSKFDSDLSENYQATDISYSDKKTNNFIFSPNVGMRLKLNRFAVDAKFLLSFISRRGDVDYSIEMQKQLESNIVSSTEEWTDEISNKFKLKPAVMLSMSYFF